MNAAGSQVSFATPSASQPGTFVRLLQFALPLWPWVGLSALLGLATVVSGVGLLAASAWIIASAALRPSIAVLQVAIVGVRFFGISRGVFRYLERLASHEATFRLLARFRVWFYAHLEPQAPAVLVRHRSGDLLARIVADVGTLEHFYVRVLAPPLVALGTAAAAYVFFAAYDPVVAAAVLVCLALAGAGVPALVYRLSLSSGRQVVAARGELNAELIDGIQGLPDLLAFGREQAYEARLWELSADLGRAQSRLASTRGLQTALSSLITSLAVASVLALAIPLVRAARLTGVDLAVLALATSAVFEAVLPLPLAAQHLESSLAAARRLFDVVDHKTPAAKAPVDPAGTTPYGVPATARDATNPAGHLLEVDGLTFRYAPDEPLALEGIGFRLAAGQCMAVVGPSGAGKSTLINLLLRVWDYEEGKVRLFGRDLRAYTGEEVRALIGVVAQRTHLFNGTVRDNLLLARPAASQQDIERVTQAAEIHDFIRSLPQGYDTWIGEQGVRLSGGERQRLAIARALLKDAPLLILDEATANLDPLTERAVLRSIATLMQGRATLTITHRLAGLETAGEVLVLRQGRVAERGAPASLLARGGLYRQMWDYQVQLRGIETLP